MTKVTIKSREGKNIVVLLEGETNTKGLAFVMHRLGGFKEQPHIETFAAAFLEKGFVVVRFDTRNTLGESEGRYEDATVTNYYEDLDDVINWARLEAWYQEPFALTGHSLGGICVALYAEKYLEKVLALAPISTVVSGQLSMEAHERRDPKGLAEWKRTGWHEEKSVSKPDIIKRRPWSYVEDRNKYDILPKASILNMPVLLVVGETDTSTPADHVQKFFDALSGPKEIHIIKNAPHTFRDAAHLEEIKSIFLDWISSWQR